MQTLSNFSEQGNDDEPLVIHRHRDTDAAALVILIPAFGEHLRYAAWTPDSLSPVHVGLPKFLHDDIPTVDVGLYSYEGMRTHSKFGSAFRLADEGKIVA